MTLQKLVRTEIDNFYKSSFYTFDLLGSRIYSSSSCTRKIIGRFGIPKEIIRDNRTQFTHSRFHEWCEGYQIASLIPLIPPNLWACRIQYKNNNWVDKNKIGRTKDTMDRRAPKVLWAYQTTTRTGDMPFALTYGEEVVSPIRVEASSIRTIFLFDD